MNLNKVLLSLAIILCMATQTWADTEPDNDAYTGAETLTVGTDVTGSTGNTVDDPADYYQFTTGVDGNITATMVLTGAGYAYLIIYDSNGTTELGTVLNLAPGTFSVTVNGRAGGTYYVAIKAYSAASLSDYTVSVAIASPPQANDIENNDTPGTALLMAENSSKTGHIGYVYNGGADDMSDYYQFTTTNDGNVNIAFTSSEVGHYNSIYLYDNDGTTLLTSVSGYGGASVTENGLAAGTYYVRMYYYSTSQYSGYTLTNTVITDGIVNDAEPNGTVAEALTMVENSSVTGHIGYRNNGGVYDLSDYYQFTTTNDGNINLSFLSSEAGHYNTIYLYDNNGTTLLASASGYGSASLTESGLAAGTYYARMYYYGTPNYSGYTLTNAVIIDGIVNDIEPNGTYLTALSMSENGSVNGHIGYRINGGDYDYSDYYQFTTTNDGNITIAFTSTEPSHYNTINLYDIDGTTQLATASGYGGASFTANGLAAGTYYALMYYYGATHFSGYTLTNTVTTNGIVNDLEPNDTPAQALPMSENGSVNGHIGHRINGGTYDQSDYYAFTTTNDGNITISFSSTEIGHYNSLYLYDNDGTSLLGSSSGYGSASFTSNGLAAGTYYARMYYYGASHYSGYTLTNSVNMADYTVDAEPNNDAVNALDMLTNSTMEGHIGYRNNGGTYDESDYFTFTTHSAGDLTATLANPNGQYNTVQILNSAETVIASGSNYGGTTVSELDAPAGVYYIRVHYYSSTYYTGYTITNTFCPDAITIVAEGETTFCDGESVVLSTADHHLNYLWSDGSVTETNAVTLTGDYSLTIDNGAGCVRTSNTINIESTPLPVAIIEADGPTEFCDGESVTLSVPIIADGYLWSNGATTATITVSTTGDYSVELTKNDCSAISDPIHIEVNPNPTATITPDGSTTFCEGGDVTLTATAASDYLWSNGETTSSILVDASGSFSVTITDANGCMNLSGSTTVTENSNPVATISADGPVDFCAGGDVTLTATAASAYLWSNGETTGSILVDASGSYSVTITDANGCEGTSASTSVTVNANPSADISADGSTTICEGESVNLTATGGTSYIWSTGETTTSINVTSSDNYSVTAFNLDGCSDVSDIVTVTVNVCGSVTISADGPVEFCEGGSVTLTSSEATGNIWNTGETTQSIVVTVGGDYYADNGLNTSNIISVTVNANPSAGISADGPTTICEGESVNLIAVGGTSYLWSNGETTTSINVTSSDDYSVTAFNLEGCSDVSEIITVTVNVCGSVTISADGPVEFCEGGSVTLTSTEAEGNVWNTGETTQSIVVTESGDYYAVNGLNTSNIISVIVNTNPTASITPDGATTFCEGGDVVLSATAASEYLWSNGETTSSILVDASGSYSVTITDANGCMGMSTSTDVAENLNPTPTIIADGATAFCGGSVGLSVVGTYDDYLWTTGETGTSIIVSTTGLFSVTVSENGCSGTSNEIATTSDTAPTVSISSDGTLICFEANTMLTATTDAASIQWQLNGVDIPGATNPTYSATLNGKYRAVATSGVCSSTSGEIKLKYAERIAITPSGTVNLCGPDLMMSVPVTPGATYEWYRNNTLIAGATSNTYTTTIVGKYYAFVITTGCTRASKLLRVEDDCRIGIEEEAILAVTPNPAAEMFTVHYNVTTGGNTTLLITDISGKIVVNQAKQLSIGNYTEQFETTLFTSGMYIITLIQQDGQPLQQKLVIEK